TAPPYAPAPAVSTSPLTAERLISLTSEPLTQVPPGDGVDGGPAEPALLEVLDAVEARERPLGGLVPRARRLPVQQALAREHALQPADVVLAQHPRRLRGLVEVEPVQLEQAPQLLHGRGVVVDAQVDPAVVEPRVALARAHHEQRRRLASAPVPAGGVGRREGRDEPLGER